MLYTMSVIASCHCRRLERRSYEMQMQLKCGSRTSFRLTLTLRWLVRLSVCPTVRLSAGRLSACPFVAPSVYLSTQSFMI